MYAWNIIEVPGFCPLRIKITHDNFLMDSIFSNLLEPRWSNDPLEKNRWTLWSLFTQMNKSVCW